MVDLKNDPAYNDDSQPSVTNSTQALKLADEMAGVRPGNVSIPAPSDAIDLAYRTAIADVDAQEVGQAVAAQSEAGVPAADIDVKAMGEGRQPAAAGEVTEDVGSGPYEGRTVAQLKALAASKGLTTSGSKDDLIASLRG